VLGDWLANDFPQAFFDVVIAIESLAHMADKPAFFQEAYRVLRPGGAWWCVPGWRARRGGPGWSAGCSNPSAGKDGCRASGRPPSTAPC
jgi:SAM-dependent methyltransferase